MLHCILHLIIYTQQLNYFSLVKNICVFLFTKIISCCPVCQVTRTSNICQYQLVFFIMTKWFGFHSFFLFEQFFIASWAIFSYLIIVMKELKPNILAVLYRGPLFNQSGWLFSLISYWICLLEDIIQEKPAWCHFVFNTITQT